MHQAHRPWALILMPGSMPVHDGAGMRSLPDGATEKTTRAPTKGSAAAGPVRVTGGNPRSEHFVSAVPQKAAEVSHGHYPADEIDVCGFVTVLLSLQQVVRQPCLTSCAQQLEGI